MLEQGGRGVRVGISVVDRGSIMHNYFFSDIPGKDTKVVDL